MIGAPQQSCRLGLRPSLGTHGVGIEVAFARLVDDGEDVARAYQPEIGDSGVRTDVDYRIQSLGVRLGGAGAIGYSGGGV